MKRDGLFIGEVATRGGVTRKALRIYEAAGILPAPRRSGAGYRLYTADTLAVLAFVTQARRLGLRLDEIKQIVTIKRSGRAPCRHVYDLVERKAAELDRVIADARQLRGRLRGVLRSWPAARRLGGVVCPHIEATNNGRQGDEHGKREDVALPRMHRVPGSRGGGRRGADR